MMEMSENINEIVTALSKAQAEIGNVAKDAKNPHFKADYASLGAVLETCRPVLAKHNLCILQPASSEGSGAVTVETMIAHSSGQWMRSRLSCMPGKQDAQGIGSVITYMRRYSLASMVGVAQTDDDGEGATGRGESGGPQMAPAQRAKPQQKVEKADPVLIPPPETPALIQTPVNAAGNGTDWSSWTLTFKAALESATSIGAVNAWCDRNADPLSRLMNDLPKWHAAMGDVIEKARNRFEPPAEDTGSPFGDEPPFPGDADPNVLSAG
jgi:hypothetical protein